MVSTVDDAPEVLAGEAFDVVYTGIGSLCWLSDMGHWARVVASLLAPGGRLFLREGHPIIWAIDQERDDDLLVIAHPYSSGPEPQRWEDEGSYVDVGDAELGNDVTYEWNHGLGTILTAVLEAGMVVERFEEHAEVPWEPFDGVVASPDHPGEFVLPADRRTHLPLTYTLVARRPDGPPRSG